MNRDQVKGTWAVLKGKAKRIVGELIGDENMVANGSADKLYGSVQKRLGDTKEAIKSRIDKVKLP